MSESRTSFSGYGESRTSSWSTSPRHSVVDQSTNISDNGESRSGGESRASYTSPKSSAKKARSTDIGEVRSQVMQELYDEFYDEIKDEVRQELKKEKTKIVRELKDELKAKLKTDLRNSLVGSEGVER